MSNVRKVIKAEELEYHTSNGWKLIESYEMEEVVHGYANVAGMSQFPTAESKIICSRRFIVAMTPESEASEAEILRKKLDELQHKHVELFNESALRQRGLRDLERAVEEGNRQNITLNTENNAIRKGRQEAMDKNIRYERDIAKIRTEIGEARMRDILSGEKGK